MIIVEYKASGSGGERGMVWLFVVKMMKMTRIVMMVRGWDFFILYCCFMICEWGFGEGVAEGVMVFGMDLESDW